MRPQLNYTNFLMKPVFKGYICNNEKFQAESINPQIILSPCLARFERHHTNRYKANFQRLKYDPTRGRIAFRYGASISACSVTIKGTIYKSLFSLKLIKTVYVIKMLFLLKSCNLTKQQ